MKTLAIRTNFNKFCNALISYTTEPLIEIEDPKRAFISKWLASVFITVLPIGVSVSILPDLIADGQAMLQNGETLSIIISLVLLCGCYFLFRIGRYELAMLIATTVASLLIFYVSAKGDDLDDLVFLLMPIIVLSVLLPRQIVFAVIFIDVLFWLILASVVQVELGTSFTSFLVGSMLTIFIAFHRDAIEKLNTSNLKDLNQSLESEIIEKTTISNALQRSLSEKETLLKEIHHRVKNNLQVISSLLGLQARNLKDKKLSQALIDCQNRVQAMAVVHERLYRSENLSRILADEYIRDFLKHLIQTQSQTTKLIKLDTDIEVLPLHIDIAIPCGLLINELVSNAYKHAFASRDAGEIQVTFYRQDDQYILNIKDNGQGVSDEFDFEQARSMGLQLVNTLVRQLKGTISFVNEHGISVHIAFPTHDISNGV